MIVTLLGMLATVLSTISLIPQIIEIYRKKSADGVSFFMLVAFFIGAICWISYGVLTSSYAIVFANVIFLICSSWMIFLKFHFKNKNKTRVKIF
jgi:MtN3 and saliva related transmembrane protein